MERYLLVSYGGFFVISGYVSYKISYDKKLYLKRINGLLISWIAWILLFGAFFGNFFLITFGTHNWTRISQLSL